jgi:2-amino-4-hydroxy-6-hydroxymethyldihydropteridine diphosphokinase
MNHGIFLSLGSNLGDRKANLMNARQALERLGRIISLSPTYQTDAWGKTDQPGFYNQAIEMRSDLDPHEFLSQTLTIEQDLGRVRDEKWGPRIIDIDILFFGDRIMNEQNLMLPHPGIAARKFVLVPLADIAPEFIHPIFQKTVVTLLKECNDELTVERI